MMKVACFLALSLLVNIAWSTPSLAQAPDPEPALVAAAEPQPPAPAPPTPQTPRTPAAAQTPRTPAPRAPQPPAPPEAPAAPAPPVLTSPAPPAPPRQEPQAINVRVEATITDQQTGTAPIKKTMSVVVGDGQSGGVRTLVTTYNSAPGPVPLNMDAQPVLLADGKVRLRLTLQYDLPPPAIQGGNPGGEERQATRTSINQSLTLVLDNGKAIVAAQSADPVSDRQVSLEVKATILR